MQTEDPKQEHKVGETGGDVKQRTDIKKRRADDAHEEAGGPMVKQPHIVGRRICGIG